MATPLQSGSYLTGISKRLVKSVLVAGENRFQLLMVELHEERERLLLAIWLAMGAAVFALLGGLAITLVIAIVLWNHSPVTAILVLAILYMGLAFSFYARLVRLQKEWQTLPATLDQLRKDRECLEKKLT
jgi:uncharacterized membrane protein YqjE